MDSEQTVTVLGPVEAREAVNAYLQRNLIWRAEDRDMVWSTRYVTAKLANLAGAQMTFGDLVARVAEALAETSSDPVQRLTPELIAKDMVAP